jgi:hypothetical protein
MIAGKRFGRACFSLPKNQWHDGPQINTDEHRLKRIGLSVFIGVHPLPKTVLWNFFSSLFSLPTAILIRCRSHSPSKKR